MGMALKTAETQRDGMPVIELSGRLDAMSSEEFQRLLIERIEEIQGDLVLDCKELEFVSSAGLRTFLTAQKNLQSKGAQLKLIHTGEEIMKVLVMTGFDKFLRIE